MTVTPLGRPVNQAIRWYGKDDASLSLEDLHRSYLQAVFTYVSRHVPNKTEAEDLTAEVFAAVVTQLPMYRRESGYYAWFIGIARRKISDYLRRREQRHEILSIDLVDEERETVALLVTDPDDLPEEIVLHQEARDVISKLLEVLPPPQREALLLQVIDELPIRVIAEIIGRSEAATNSLLQRARATLFKCGRSYFRE